MQMAERFSLCEGARGGVTFQPNFKKLNDYSEERARSDPSRKVGEIENGKGIK